MNQVIITKCIECANWCPANNHGTGVYCDELQQTLSELDEELDIPDYCPKLAPLNRMHHTRLGARVTLTILQDNLKSGTL
ncbi:MAG: hypothetical protein BBJ57_07250 [Desulfobacterales bacterium PC51MH44]|nr:MAG: hypothetical protein BBJ57_07250 [Desulfobacterales bacterium PC51MH44]